MLQECLSAIIVDNAIFLYLTILLFWPDHTPLGLICELEIIILWHELNAPLFLNLHRTSIKASYVYEYRLLGL